MKNPILLIALSAGLTFGAAQVSFAEGASGSNTGGTGATTSGAPPPGADNKTGNMPKTNLKETVIPKSGGTEKPVESAPKGEAK